jgi:hypothetical protein
MTTTPQPTPPRLRAGSATARCRSDLAVVLCLLGCLLCAAPVAAQGLMKPGHPETYVVQPVTHSGASPHAS